MDPTARQSGMHWIDAEAWRCECGDVNMAHEAFCYRCGAGQPEDPAPAVRHDPIHLSKVGSAYTTDEGEEVPSHTLHRFACLCGWQGACWYVSATRAQGHYDGHLAVPVDPDREETPDA